MGADVKQVGGSHYRTDNGVQHWDWAENLGYLEGCATKYIGRHTEKEGLVAIKKALTYIQKIVWRHYNVKLTWSIDLDTTRRDRAGSED